MILKIQIIDSDNKVKTSTVLDCKTTEGAGLLNTGEVLTYTYNLLKKEILEKIKDKEEIKSENNL
jgi:hypothetical protein